MDCMHANEFYASHRILSIGDGVLGDDIEQLGQQLLRRVREAPGRR